MEYDVTVIRSDRKTMELQIKNGAVFVRAPKEAADVQIESFIKDHQGWIEKHLKKQEEEHKAAENQPKLSMEEINDLADQALDVIPKRVRYYAEKIGVTYGRITIRCQRTKWGSCSSKGNLNFNCLLMLMPQEVIDCVVVHELCHRKEMNHSAKFYEEVHKAYPEYDKWNKWLKDHGTGVMSRIP